MQWFWGNRVAVLGISVGCILALGYMDYRTAFEFDLFLFYALPVAMAAWGVGHAGAVATATLSVVTWFCANLIWANPYSSRFYEAWNTGLRCGWILLVALAIAQIRAHLSRERQLNVELTQALGQVKQLRGLLPICAWCKKIRNDAGYWEQVEAYLSRTTDATFTHGICPACAASLLGKPTREETGNQSQ